MIKSFNPSIATQFSIDSAIFIQHLAQCSYTNLARRRHIHDGHVWTYDTLDSLALFFPYWTIKQIRRVIKNCINEGLIIKGNYNQTTYDRTCWYALTDKAMSYFPELLTPEMLLPLWTDECPNREIDLPKWANGRFQTGTTIPTNILLEELSNDNSKATVNNSSLKKTKDSKELELMKEDNPHEIPEQMLQDFTSVRKEKKAKITKTAWNKINKTLTQIYEELGIKPVEAFETMVTASWQSINIEYFKNKSKQEKSRKKEPHYI